MRKAMAAGAAAVLVGVLAGAGSGTSAAGGAGEVLRVQAVFLPAAPAAPAAGVVPAVSLLAGTTAVAATRPLEDGAPVEDGTPVALTYDATLVPAGAAITVTQHQVGEGTMVAVAVDGVAPGHTFGGHVHTEPCADDPAAAGGHYQDRPGEDPGLANPGNEVWLDFTADASGDGRAVALQDWSFREGGAGSVVLHEHATETGHHGGTPGHAGDRVACVTVPFVGEPASPTVVPSEGE
ncbi:superoxide dismutase family protein [Streptomyces sp. B6B3]|uniref:superoxide dismutase family protein n=1 Tax=Streptomyces sp. B6B3 TaxID=3153570 RepID=UPI00325E2B48